MYENVKQLFAHSHISHPMNSPIAAQPQFSSSMNISTNPANDKGNANSRSLIQLSNQEYELVKSITATDTNDRRRKRAQALMMLHDNCTMKEVATKLKISNPTVQKVKDRYLRSGNIEEALTDKQRSGRPIVFTPAIKVEIVNLSKSQSPDGTRHWTLRSLAKAAMDRKIVESISHQQIKNILSELKVS
jgi:putative transposase